MDLHIYHSKPIKRELRLREFENIFQRYTLLSARYRIHTKVWLQSLELLSMVVGALEGLRSLGV